MVKLFGRKNVKAEAVAKPDLTVLHWQRNNEYEWVAYPPREWQRYTIVSTVNGYAAKLTGYRFFLTLGTHKYLSAAMKACEDDNRKRA